MVKKEKSSRPSIRDIAREAGISVSATYYALQNKPKVSRATRDRVLGIAKRRGYVPDARMAVVMASVRRAEARDLLPIAWLNTHTEKDAWQKYKFLSPYMEGARERCLQLGYRLDEIWLHQPGMTMRRVSQILYQRGIEGVIITNYMMHFRLNWAHLASVSIEHATLAPRLPRVITDHFSNFLLAIKMLKRFGYRRIGICLAESIDRQTQRGISAITHELDARLPKARQVPPFVYPESCQRNGPVLRKQIIAWLRRHQPDVIVGHDNRLVEWVEDAGYRVPGDIGVVHLATDDDVSDWAGIFSNKRVIGGRATEWVISLIRDRQFGVPKPDLRMTVRGTWHPGRTLLIPKPK